MNTVPSASLPRGPIADRYQAMVAAGTIEADPAQVALVARMDELVARLAEHRLARKSSALGWLFGRREQKAAPLRGLYVWGSVGRGKTMLMDLFFAAATVQRKRRVHFHAFMSEVHERIHDERDKMKRGVVKSGDPIAPVAKALAAQAWLLCFDEFTVTDIADAMILGRLFDTLFAEGVVLVATSNVEPSRLYEGGLNRALFLPFLETLRLHVDVARLDARTDYRLEKLSGADVWHVPADAAARAELDEVFARLTDGATASPATLRVKGRDLAVPAQARGVARFDFPTLCGEANGASDYLALARDFHTLVLDGIPVMAFEKRNEAKRFILLIDALYEAGVKLVASAEAEPHALYLADHGREAFEFDRTVSRLIEMRSHDYLARPHGAADSAASGDTTGLVET